MQNLFHPSLYRFDEAQPSYWEASAPAPDLHGRPLSGAESCEVAIIGGGYTGLSAALHLARDFDTDVRILEAGHIGWGASGRNGGFCSMGSSKLSIETQISKFGLEQTKYFHRCQKDAVHLVRALGDEEAIDYLAQGDGMFYVADSERHFQKLKQRAEFQRSNFGFEIDCYTQSQFREIGYDSPHQHGAIRVKPSFALHPLRYVHGLARAAERRGAQIHPHSRVLNWRKEGRDHLLETERGRLRAARVVLAANGFMPEYLACGIEGRPLPVQSAIVVSRPMSAAELKDRQWLTETPAVNSRHLYFYYRLLSDNRFLLGARADQTGDPQSAEKTFACMQQSIARMWPQFADLSYDYRWRGLVCLARNLRPSIGRMPEDKSIYFAYGYHGTGVSTATWSGRELAKWLAGKESNDQIMPAHLPAIMQGRSPRFPLAFLRRHYVRASIATYRLRDLLGI